MKIVMIIIGSILVLFTAFQIYTTMSTAKTETQAYTVIQSEKEFEIRLYPPATIATVHSNARTYKELGSSGFSKLAGYIFGGNTEGKKIAMTSPVHMAINDTSSSMSFVMPSSYNKNNLPLPNDPDVNIKTSPEEYVAAITFSGFASNENIQKQTQRLTDALNAHNIPYYGNFRYLGYNPPYQLFDRKNEIIVAVDWKAADKDIRVDMR